MVGCVCTKGQNEGKCWFGKGAGRGKPRFVKGKRIFELSCRWLSIFQKDKVGGHPEKEKSAGDTEGEWPNCQQSVGHVADRRLKMWTSCWGREGRWGGWSRSSSTQTCPAVCFWVANRKNSKRRERAGVLPTRIPFGNLSPVQLRSGNRWSGNAFWRLENENRNIYLFFFLSFSFRSESRKRKEWKLDVDL